MGCVEPIDDIPNLDSEVIEWKGGAESDSNPGGKKCSFHITNLRMKAKFFEVFQKNLWNPIARPRKKTGTNVCEAFINFPIRFRKLPYKREKGHDVNIDSKNVKEETSFDMSPFKAVVHGFLDGSVPLSAERARAKIKS